MLWTLIAECLQCLSAHSVFFYMQALRKHVVSNKSLGSQVPSPKYQVSGLGLQVLGLRSQFTILWFSIHRSQVPVRGLKADVLGSPKIA